MWHFRELVVDAWRNFGPRQLFIGMSMLVILAGVGLLYGLVAASALEQEWALRQAGSAVIKVQYQDSPDEAKKLWAKDCEDLNGISGVVAGGVGFDKGMGDELVGVSASFPISYVTLHAGRVWNNAQPLHEIMIGAEFEALQKATVGSTLFWKDGVVSRITARTPANAPARLQSLISVPRGDDFLLAECWVRVRPGQLDAGIAMAKAAFAQRSVDVVPWLKPTPGMKTPMQQWDEFTKLQPWVLGGLLLGFIMLLMSWMRRTEFAVYKAAGTSRVQIVMLAMIETLLVLVPTMLAAITLTIAAFGILDVASLSHGFITAGIQAIGATALLTFTLNPLITWATTKINVYTQFKE